MRGSDQPPLPRGLSMSVAMIEPWGGQAVQMQQELGLGTDPLVHRALTPLAACTGVHCMQSPPLHAEPSTACTAIHCVQSLPAFQVQAKPAQEQQGVCNHVCFWNGGVGEAQLLWLRTVLSDARSRGQRALVFGHIPLLPAAGGANGRYAEPHHTIPCRMMSHIIPYPAVC